MKRDITISWILLGILTLIAAFIFIWPLLWAISTSLKSEMEFLDTKNNCHSAKLIANKMKWGIEEKSVPPRSQKRFPPTRCSSLMKKIGNDRATIGIFESTESSDEIVTNEIPPLSVHTEFRRDTGGR